MRNNWIKVEDKLPELLDITDQWGMSATVLALVQGKYPVLAALNANNNIGPIEWLFSGRGDITHWQPIELPE